ncbi:MAG: exosortase-associated EpsI family protein [Isosphaeraceae bacterium]
MGIIRIVMAAAVIIGAGLIHGAWTNRWGASPALVELAARYESVPMIIGDWRATPFELGADERRMAGAEACLARVYTNARSGASVSVLLLGGLPGDIATHTPDVCYPGAGYVLDSPAAYSYSPHDRGGPHAEFLTSLASRGGANPSVLRIFWTWHTSKGWVASDRVRWEFASAPILSKLYLVRETGGAPVEPDRDPCVEFLDVFLPELERAVFPAAAQAVASSPESIPTSNRAEIEICKNQHV